MMTFQEWNSQKVQFRRALSLDLLNPALQRGRSSVSFTSYNVIQKTDNCIQNYCTKLLRIRTSVQRWIIDLNLN